MNPWAVGDLAGLVLLMAVVTVIGWRLRHPKPPRRRP